MAAASAIAEEPNRLEKVFLNLESTLDKKGIYGVNVYLLGVPHTVIVDDYLPLKEDFGGYKTHFAHIGHDTSLWGAILEKAFAKLHGNYQRIEGGDPRVAVRTLIGSPHDILMHSG